MSDQLYLLQISFHILMWFVHLWINKWWNISLKTLYWHNGNAIGHSRIQDSLMVDSVSLIIWWAASLWNLSWHVFTVIFDQLNVSLLNFPKKKNVIDPEILNISVYVYFMWFLLLTGFFSIWPLGHFCDLPLIKYFNHLRCGVTDIIDGITPTDRLDSSHPHFQDIKKRLWSRLIISVFNFFI